MWSVSGVCAGCVPAAPGVLLSLGVPTWLRKEELSEVGANTDGFILPTVKPWGDGPMLPEKYEKRAFVIKYNCSALTRDKSDSLTNEAPLKETILF